jgi:hypothetical protein
MKNKTNNEKKSKKIANENNHKKGFKNQYEKSCIIDMELHHRLKGIKINIKKIEDDFGEISIKKQKDNTTKKPKTNERNL